MEHVRQNQGQAKSSPRNKRSGPTHGVGGVPPYTLAPHPSVLSAPRSRDASPNRGATGFGPPSNVPVPHYPPQPSIHTPSQGTLLPPHSQLSMPVPPPLGTQRMGLLPHPVFPPPPLVLPGTLPPSQAHIQFPQGAPPPLPLPGELAGMTSLTDITNTVSSLGFPASCNFVLGLLQSYFTTCLASADTKSKPPSQLTRDNLKTLADLFILCQSRLPPDRDSKFITPPLTPLEEMQLLLSLHGQLEDQQSLELHYCIFDAVFGGITIPLESPPDERFDILKKLVSFAISVDSCSILSCASLWMKTHTCEATALVKALYHDFCVLLPDAFEPLFQVPATSVHFAQQLVVVFTALYPFHTVGSSISSGSNLDSAHLNPPIRILQIISHWVSTFPDLLSPDPLMDKELPIINSKTPNSHSIFVAGQPDPSPNAVKSLLPGLIQWCVLAPLAPVAAKSVLSNGELCTGNETNLKQTLKDGVSRHHTDNQADTLRAIRGLSLLATDEEDRYDRSENKTSTGTECDVKESTHSILASLHADLLSNILSLSKPSKCQLSGDDIAVVVAALLGYFGQRTQQETEAKLRGEERSSLSVKMDDCVERLAQILQICLSSGLINLRPDDISSIASTLPKNRLLELVISHAHKSK